MSNPYEDYDSIDPWEDDSGEFAFVEDEYDSMSMAGDDGLGSPYADDQFDMSATVRPGSTEVFPSRSNEGSRPRSNEAFRPTSNEDLPKTMVRKPYGEPVRDAYDDTHGNPGHQSYDQSMPDATIPQPATVLRRKPGYGRRAGDHEHHDRMSPDHAYPEQAYSTEDVGYWPQGDGGYGQQPVRPVEPVRPEAPPRPPRRRRHHGCLTSLFFIILLVVAATVGVYWVVARPIDEKLAFSPQEEQSVDGTLSWSLPGMPYYVLALGSDAREGETYSRTDTMVLMRVDLLGGRLTMVSIPRDTKVELEGQGSAKINAAYAYGGAGGAVKAVSKLVGVPINHVVVIHFEELVGLIDYLGGVSVNVPVGVTDPYTGVSLDSGIQTMDGTTALLWARSRYGYEEGDFQRQEDQRVLITAIMNRILSLSPNEIPGVFNQLGDLIGTDMRCYNLVPLFLRFKLGTPRVYSCTLPTTSAYVDEQWYEIVDDAAMAQVMQVVNAGGDPSVIV